MNDYAKRNQVNKLPHEVITRNESSVSKPHKSWRELIIGLLILYAIVLFVYKVWSKRGWPFLFFGDKGSS
jgi:hypothetical protein